MTLPQDKADPQLPRPGGADDAAPGGLEPALPGQAAWPIGVSIAGRQPVVVNEALLEHVIDKAGHYMQGFPRQHRMRAAALLMIRSVIPPGRGFPETDINDVLRRHAPGRLDPLTARVYMMEYGMLERFADGSQYWTSDRWREFVSCPPELEAQLPAYAERMAEAVRSVAGRQW